MRPVPSEAYPCQQENVVRTTIFCAGVNSVLRVFSKKLFFRSNGHCTIPICLSLRAGDPCRLKTSKHLKCQTKDVLERLSAPGNQGHSQ